MSSSTVTASAWRSTTTTVAPGRAPSGPRILTPGPDRPGSPGGTVSPAGSTSCDTDGWDEMSTEDRLPAEMRVTPTTEPTVEVDAGAHVPPEAAVVARTHEEGTASPGGRGA